MAATPAEPPDTEPPAAEPPAARPPRAAAPIVGCVFIGTSLDGFIARENGSFDWLVAAGDALGETGYDDFFAGVDAIVLGRATYDTVSAFPEWPYAGKRVLVLSRTLPSSPHTAPHSAATPDTTVHASLDNALDTLAAEGHHRIYVDGGRTIQSFLRAGLIREITISRAPVLLGTGIPLFGPLDADVHLQHVSSRELGADFTQSTYTVPET